MKKTFFAALLLPCLLALAETPAGAAGKPDAHTRGQSPTPAGGAEKTPQSADLSAENQKLKTELALLKSGKEGAGPSVAELNAEIARLNSEVTAVKQASANVLQIQNERDQLTREKVTLASELATLRREKQAQDASAKQDWFMAGAGVLLAGILLGLVLPRLGWRKKSSWDSF